MYIILPEILSTKSVQLAQSLLVDASWEDGRKTAGPEARVVKNNLQLPHKSEAAEKIRLMILEGLNHSNLFFSAALPKKIFTPRINCYNTEHPTYGSHYDNSIMIRHETQERVRTDLSCTVFLNNPDDYEGGELLIRDRDAQHKVKLAAGDGILYLGNTLHEVCPVISGKRLASFFWIESMVRDSTQRQLLHDLDMTILKLRSDLGESPETMRLTGTYHNLLRLWADS